MKIFKVTPGKDLNPCHEKKLLSVMEWIQNAEVGDMITIEIKEMKEEDFDSLPEYEGP